MKIDKNIFRSLALINQIGISMLVPIFLSIYVGNQLDKWMNANYFTIVFLILGILAAFRNVYHLTKGFYKNDKRKENNINHNCYDTNQNNISDKAEDEFKKWINEKQNKS